MATYPAHTVSCRCFPIVPKLACHHLGISILKPSKPLTLLGGLTSFGGAGNNYSMHVRDIYLLIPLGKHHCSKSLMVSFLSKMVWLLSALN